MESSGTGRLLTGRMGTVETWCTEVGTGTGRSTGGADGVDMVF